MDFEKRRFVAFFTGVLWKLEQRVLIFLQTARRQYRQQFCEKKTTSSRHQHIGISKGGQTTKIHAVVDALGYPIKLLLSAGNVNDITVDIGDLSTKSKDVADIFLSLVQIHLWSVGKLMNINTVKVTMSSVFSNC